MAYKDILLLLDDGKTNAARIRAGISIAVCHDANLTGVALGSMKPVHAPATGEQAVAGFSRQMAERLTTEFTVEANEAGLESSSLTIFGDATASGEKLAHYARNFDLVILIQPNPAQDNYEWLLEVARQVMLLSGRPLFIMPYIGANKIPIKHIMIAWDGTPAVSRAVHDAIPVMRYAEDVIVLVVESKKQKEQKKEVLVDGLLTHLSHHDINARIQRINPGDNSVTTVI